MHDPMAAFPPEQLDPAPWASLAAQARQLAELADRLAAKDPAELAPTETGNPLAALDAAALAVRSAAAACRRATYEALINDSGWSKADLARGWNVRPSAISNVLSGGDRPR